MPARTFTADGVTWAVAPSGIVTANNRDEFGLTFTRVANGQSETRVTRYSPGATRSREQAFVELSDDSLRTLLSQSQALGTSPQGNYGAPRR